ncbi:M23 family metallopeptidase [Streptomyces sp. NPDC052236]|uniref:M23 family metallopeptidase n=1 Tax=Streptomyces sp. NPDC052236 TaxID=3365686 RepID=UPI0037D0CC66
MTDQHAHAGYVAYDGHTTGSFDIDPLFGALPGNYEAGQSGQYDSTQWDTGSHQTTGYDTYAAQQPQEFAQYDTTGQYDATGQWDANAWNQTAQTGQYETAAATFAYETDTSTGTYDATAWNTGTGTGTGAEAATAFVPQQFTPEHEFIPEVGYEAGYEPGYKSGYENPTEFQPADYPHEFEAEHEHEQEPEQAPEAEAEFEPEHEPGLEPETLTPVAPVTPYPVRRSGGSRGRRRTPAKRSALLTVAVPSACVMGVAGIAAASVGGIAADDGESKAGVTTLTAADPSSVKPVAANNKIDTQLAALSADARDFGDRASRTQERLDLKARQDADKKKRKDAAERLERLRPKFVLPVAQEGLSAGYGQAGVNWMSVHTGIDFPVSYGTEVRAVTDGTVRTQWNGAYGNMAIVTAPDGTETWYCHLSSTRMRSGSVKAGDVIAYSGNSGNSTGPHLHFEVRPGGGSAIDPLAWLRSHGLDPT